MALIIKSNKSVPILGGYDELHVTIDKGAVAITYLFCALFIYISSILAFVLYIWL